MLGMLASFFLPRICCWLVGRHSWRPRFVIRRVQDVHLGSRDGRNGRDMVCDFGWNGIVLE